MLFIDEIQACLRLVWKRVKKKILRIISVPFKIVCPFLERRHWLNSFFFTIYKIIIGSINAKLDLCYTIGYLFFFHHQCCFIANNWITRKSKVKSSLTISFRNFLHLGKLWVSTTSKLVIKHRERTRVYVIEVQI